MQLEKQIKVLRKEKIQIVAVSVDTMKDNAKLASDLKLTFPVLSDPKAATIKIWGVYDPGNETAWPATYLVAPSGKVLLAHTSDTYKSPGRATGEQMLKALKQAAKTP